MGGFCGGGKAHACDLKGRRSNAFMKDDSRRSTRVFPHENLVRGAETEEGTSLHSSSNRLVAAITPVWGVRITTGKCKIPSRLPALGGRRSFPPPPRMNRISSTTFFWGQSLRISCSARRNKCLHRSAMQLGNAHWYFALSLMAGKRAPDRVPHTGSHHAPDCRARQPRRRYAGFGLEHHFSILDVVVHNDNPGARGRRVGLCLRRTSRLVVSYTVVADTLEEDRLVAIGQDGVFDIQGRKAGVA